MLLIDYRSNQQWCTECNSEATQNCKHSRHQLGNFDDVCTSCSLILKETIIKSNSACDQALQGCRQIQSSHEVILARIQWLKTEMSKKVTSNNARIAHLESLKSEDYGVDASNEKDMTATMDKIIQLVNKYVIFQNLFVFVGFCFIHFNGLICCKGY